VTTEAGYKLVGFLIELVCAALTGWLLWKFVEWTLR